jgi:macrolide-specific efflux system membrane fusion protein
MTASVKVIVNHADNVVYLPSSALTARGTSATVNVEIGTNPNKTTPTPITLGLRGDTSTAVTSGLKAGDKIVVVRQVSAGGVGTSTGAGARAATGGGGAAAIGGGAARVGG